jgi:hypothetical protein
VGTWLAVSARLLAGVDQPLQRCPHRGQVCDLAVQVGDLRRRQRSRLAARVRAARGELEERFDLGQAEAELLRAFDEPDDSHRVGTI